MSLTKQSVSAAASLIKLPDGRDLVESGALQWATACDTYGSCRICVDDAGISPTATQTLEALAAALIAKIRSQSPIDSFVIDYIDRNGTVVHTVRQGAMKQPPLTLNAGSNPSPNPSSNPTTTDGGGHSPIKGLNKPPAEQSQAPSPLAPSPQGVAPSMPGVRHAIAVGAGKGGVGKSSIALNLAVGLARRGHAVGLLDADIYGPSMPTMLGLQALEPQILRGMLQPFVVHGIRCMTIGKLVDPEKALIWRGPMAHGAFKQLADQTQWGELDYLIIDLPPGTGDVSLTMSQVLRLTGAVVVCTPQKVAQDDAVRATKMFQQLGIEVLGVVENMSTFVADDGKVYEIFGKGGAEHMAQRLGVPFLGAVPLTISLRINSDMGDPTSNFTAKGATGIALASALDRMIDTFEGQVALASMRTGGTRPSLTIS